MKIFVLRNAWTEKDFGGAEEFALLLVKELCALGTDATLVSGTDSVQKKAGELSAPFIKGPFSHHQILTKHRSVFLPKYLFDLASGYREYLALFRQHKPDVVHATGQQDCISATAAAWKLGIPVVWSDHGELKNSIGFRLFPPWGIPGLLLKKNLRRIKAVFMINPADIAFIASVNKQTPIVQAPNGVLDTQAKSEEPAYDLVFASRIIKEKGIFELLDAYKSLLETYPDLSLLIAGEGPSLQKTIDYTKTNNLKNVTIQNYSDEAIQKGKLFVLPTYTEAQSLAILKAMMYEKPIITTNIDGNTHFLTHDENALLIEPGSSDALLKVLSILLVDEKKQNSLSKAARKYYEHKHGLKDVTKEHYMKLYESLLKD